ncbi:MAG: cation:proton antiporter [Bauldia sp.]|nr:cation:proton antiporter [Bauldia sp.]
MLDAGWGRELLLFLGTAGIVVPLFGKLRFGIIPGFLIAGVALGPDGLGHLAGEWPWLAWVTFPDPERVRPLAELGVVFLLFLIGLEFSFERLWAMRRYVVGVGALQVFGAMAVLIAAAIALGVDPAVALIAGLALCLSSTAIATQVLIDRRRFALPVGRLSIGVLLFQDLMVVPIVVVVEMLGGEGEGGAVVTLLRAFGLAVLAVAGILLVGRFLARPLLRAAAASRSRDLVVAIALFLAAGTAVLTASAGLSPALGAFLAGLLLAESEYRHQLEVDVEPFKGLLLGLFFMTVGMSIDVLTLLSEPLLYVAIVLGILLVKAVTAFAAARALRIETTVAVEAAFLLAGAGEFAFVVFTLARRHALLATDQTQFLLAVAALSMFAIPAMAAAGHRIAAHTRRHDDDTLHGPVAGELGALGGHVIIGGFGRVGRTVARLLEDSGIPYVALDLDSALCARERQAGRLVYYGDGSHRAILGKVGGERARAFVVTTDDPRASEQTVREIRAAWPSATVLARARDAAHARHLHSLGVDVAVPETLEGSLQLGAAVLRSTGLPEDAAHARVEQLRREETRKLSGDAGPVRPSAGRGR